VTENPSKAAVSHKQAPLSWREISLVITLSITVVLSSLNVVDDYAEADLDALFQRALISFALARTLNGVISAVQGTEVALQPAGVGVTLTPGEILDPVNDLVERFSWIMLAATISLGIQQVLLDVGQWWGLRILLIVLALGWLALRLWRRKKSSSSRPAFEQALVYMLVAIVFIRFAVPLALIANEAVYALFLESRYLASTQELEKTGQALEGEEITDSATAAESESRSIIGQVFDGARKTLDLEQKVADIKQKTAELIEHLIQLSVVFILQTGILPLVFLWILLSLFRFLFRMSPQPLVLTGV
jgi:uncharacterized membrane protein SirB2